MTQQVASKYEDAANSLLRPSREMSHEDFVTWRSEVVAIADVLDCGIWHAAWVWDQRNVANHTFCAICGGRTNGQPEHALCAARKARGRTTPRLDWNSTCGCYWEGCTASR